MKNRFNYQIFVQGLRLAIRLGCRQEERVEPQAVKLDLTFVVELNHLASEINETVCYLTAAELSIKHAAKKEWVLIENYLESLIDEFFIRFSSCSQIEVVLTKYVVPGCEGAGVKIIRRRLD